MVGVIGVTVGVFGGLNAAADRPETVRICHATSSATNPYSSIEVALDAIDGAGGNDHTSHSGDIIPPVDGVTTGLNWTTAGQAIWNNDCQTATSTSTTTTSTTTTTTIATTTTAEASTTSSTSTSTTLPASTTTDPPKSKVRICHALPEEASHDYNSIEVAVDAIDGVGENDHSSHSGDIIPPVDGVTTGLNWTTAGQAIWENDCVVPEEVGVADISIDKQASTGNVTAGGAIAYTIIAHNTGGMALLQPVITDLLPSEVTLSTWSIEDGAGDCVVSVVTPPQVVTCTMDDPLPIGGFTKEITLNVIVDANLAVDSLVQNQAKVLAAYVAPNQAIEAFGQRRTQDVAASLSCSSLPANTVCALSAKVGTTATATVTTTTAVGSDALIPTTAAPTTTGLASQALLPSTGDASGGVLYLGSFLAGLGCLVVAGARRPVRP